MSMRLLTKTAPATARSEVYECRAEDWLPSRWPTAPVAGDHDNIGGRGEGGTGVVGQVVTGPGII